MNRITVLGVGLLSGLSVCGKEPAPTAESSTPTLSVENVSVARSDIRIWNVESTGPVHEGSTTSNESGTVNLQWSDGSTTSHDANYKSTSPTLFQDGKVCHNYGPACSCGTTTFRLESGMKMWKFGTPSGNEPVACPSGVQPTGDAEIRKSLTEKDLEAAKARARAIRKSPG